MLHEPLLRFTISKNHFMGKHRNSFLNHALRTQSQAD